MSALSAALLIFSFQFSLFFFIISVVRPHQHCGVLLVLIRNIGHRTLPKIWVVNFLVRNVGPTTHREDFELILTVKIETRHPLESQFGSDFPVICNHCVAMMAWSRKTWKFCEQFCVLGKIFKIPATPIDVVVFKCRKICPKENGWNCVLFTWPKTKQNFGCLSNCRYCADRAQSLLGPAPNNVFTVLQVSSELVHSRRCYSWTHKHRFL